LSDSPTLLEGHISRAFDGDLAALQLRVTALGGLVLDQVRGAVAAYADWRAELAADVTAREPQVNAGQLEIDHDALRVIARRQPVAQDLRAILSFERCVSDLERIGDEANKIARLVLHSPRDEFASRPGPATARDVRQLG